LSCIIHRRVITTYMSMIKFIKELLLVLTGTSRCVHPRFLKQFSGKNEHGGILDKKLINLYYSLHIKQKKMCILPSPSRARCGFKLTFGVITLYVPLPSLPSSRILSSGNTEQKWWSVMDGTGNRGKESKMKWSCLASTHLVRVLTFLMHRYISTPLICSAPTIISPWTDYW
jgi:hypothetical protein